MSSTSTIIWWEKSRATKTKDVSCFTKLTPTLKRQSWFWTPCILAPKLKLFSIILSGTTYWNQLWDRHNYNYYNIKSHNNFVKYVLLIPFSRCKTAKEICLMRLYKEWQSNGSTYNISTRLQRPSSFHCIRTPHLLASLQPHGL